MATAIAQGMWGIRADVAGQTPKLTSHGSAAIVDPKKTVVRTAMGLSEDVITATIEVTSRMAAGDVSPN